MTDRWRSGAAAMLGASALVALTSLIAKALGQPDGGTPLHPLQVSAGRFAFALLALTLTVPLTRPTFRGAAWSRHLMRSLSGWLGVSCLFAAAASMPLAEATAISFLSPLVTMALAVPLLGERVGARRWFAVSVSLVGAMILVRPGTAAFQPVALVALGAAFFLGLEAIFIKRLGDTEPAIRILLVNNAFGTLVSLAAASVVWQAPSASQWGLLVLLGVVMATAQSLFVRAMQLGDASRVIPLFYTVLLFAALYDLALYGVVPGPVAAAGAAFIVAGAFIVSAPGGAHRN